MFGIDDVMMAALMTGGGLLNNAFAPSVPTGQTHESFSGPTNAALLGQANQFAQGLGNAMTDKANQPVQLKGAIAQTPGGFKAGHGLPMDIGLSGMDPAMGDPSMLNKSGMNMPHMGPIGGGGGGVPNGGPPPSQAELEGSVSHFGQNMIPDISKLPVGTPAWTSDMTASLPQDDPDLIKLIQMGGLDPNRTDPF